MAEVKRKSILKGCKHESTSEGSVLAKNGDDLAFLACDECGTIFAWERVKKAKDETPVEKATKVAEKPKTAKKEVEAETVAEEPAKESVSGRPTKARPKPKADKPVEEPVADAGPIVHSNSFETVDIEADGDNVVFNVKNEKDKTFSVIRESTAEKVTAVVSAKDKYIGVTAIVVSYTTVDKDGLPTDGTFEQMVNITKK
jgi:hypothetical protein